MAIVVLSSLSGPAGAQSCTSYLANKFSEAKTRAVECGLDEGRIGSIEDSSSSPGLCDLSAERVQSQLGAFKACSAVYWCATEAYRCALKKASAGASCEEAMQQCVAENPIPQIQ